MRAYTRTVHILYEERVARAYIRENAHKMDDTDVKYGEIFYSDIRYYSWNKKAEDRNTWFDDLTLPNKNLTIYVTKCVHGNRCNNDNQVKVMDKVLGDEFLFNSYDAKRFGYRRTSGDCVLITDEMMNKYNISYINSTYLEDNIHHEIPDNRYFDIVTQEEMHLLTSEE